MKITRLIITIIIGTLLALGSHILLMKTLSPIVAHFYSGYVFPDPGQYSFEINIFAYITAFEQVIVTTIVYYFVSDLIKTSNLLKILLLSAILLELHGDLFRMTFMNAIVAHTVGVDHFIMAACLSQLNQWVSTLLLITTLVFICPFKKYSKIYSESKF